MTVTYTVGDTREVIKGIADGSVDLIASSPPFLALRSYVPADHVSKGDEIGSERNPAEFIDMLLGLTAEWGRVLAAHGSIAIELGDTYSGSGSGENHLYDSGYSGGRHGNDTKKPPGSGTRSGRDRNRLSEVPGQGGGTGWPRAKSLALIPQLYAVALAYGINPLTGQPSPAGRWLVRNVIVWHRPNPAVGALGDKVRPSTSYIVVATRSPKRWFDLTAVRGDFLAPRNNEANLARGGPTYGLKGPNLDRGDLGAGNFYSPHAGAPPLDAWFDQHDGTHGTWTLTTQPSRLAHYAMWPAKLAERLILSMCPREVCRVCGEPRRRVEGVAEYVKPDGTGHRFNGDAFIGDLTLGNRRAVTGADNGNMRRTAPTLGWTDCGHGDYRPGMVLDPFVGSGTTICVADLHGRDGIGIDFDPRNRDIWPKRMEEVRRALFGTMPELPGQMGMFDEVPA